MVVEMVMATMATGREAAKVAPLSPTIVRDNYLATAAVILALRHQKHSSELSRTAACQEVLNRKSSTFFPVYPRE
jgi:hypothetical protein